MEESAGWYELREPGLGDEFVAAVEATVARILKHPERWRQIEAGVRGCRMDGFPFVVIYRLREPRVQIVAVSHRSRLSGYGKGRVGR